MNTFVNSFLGQDVANFGIRKETKIGKCWHERSGEATAAWKRSQLGVDQFACQNTNKNLFYYITWTSAPFKSVLSNLQ
jgi:hypothetical protein